MKGHKSLYLLFIILIFFSHFITSAEADNSVNHLFLVQNSGWMEPFYTDTNSKFRTLISSVINKVCKMDEDFVIASFNQSEGTNISPLMVFQGREKKNLAVILNKINLAKKQNNRCYENTDFKEAVIKSITQFSPGKPCILWIFTNNKNSPNNSSETSEKNREFYSWLQKEENIKRIIAYPYPMPVKGSFFEANGLMIYAMAYGKAADIHLQNLLKAKLPFNDQPARLKPLSTDAVTFVPTSIALKDGINVFLGADHNTVILHFNSSSRPPVAEIKGTFRNDFYPYDIHSANVELNVKFRNNNHGIHTDIKPHNLTSVLSGKESDQVIVKIAIPPLPSIWSHPDIIIKSGYHTNAVMEFILSEQDLQVSKDFILKMDKIFPGDPLPEIFNPGNTSKQSVTMRPLVVNVDYPLWPLVILIILGLLFFFITIWFITTITKAKKYTLVVNGTQKTYALKAFTECIVYSNGHRIGVLKRFFFKPIVKLESGVNDKVNIL